MGYRTRSTPPDRRRFARRPQPTSPLVEMPGQQLKPSPDRLYLCHATQSSPVTCPQLRLFPDESLARLSQPNSITAPRQQGQRMTLPLVPPFGSEGTVSYRFVFRELNIEMAVAYQQNEISLTVRRVPRRRDADQKPLFSDDAGGPPDN